MTIQILFLIFIFFAFSRVFVRFRSRDITTREFVLWSFFWAITAVVVAWPEVTSIVARALHVGRGVDVAIYIALLLVFYILFRIFGRLDRIERDMTKLTRTRALEDNE